jgi:glyoxylase-like metal-dependent hydrolase (beta-lactamase superfamily II)
LFERDTGVLFAADAIYDGPLIYEGPGMSLSDYRATFDLLKTLPVTVVHGGHDPSFDRLRMLEIIAAYELKWDAA